MGKRRSAESNVLLYSYIPDCVFMISKIWWYFQSKMLSLWKMIHFSYFHQYMHLFYLKRKYEQIFVVWLENWVVQSSLPFYPCTRISQLFQLYFCTRTMSCHLFQLELEKHNDYKVSSCHGQKLLLF